MSAPSSVGQPASSRNWGYSRGWRLFSVIILRLLLRLLMSHEWQGKENFPGTGGVILAPNHLSYADWPTIALFSDAYGHRYPVFMIKSAVFEVKVLGPLRRGAAGADHWRSGGPDRALGCAGHPPLRQ